jgi:hypothetical protein
MKRHFFRFFQDFNLTFLVLTGSTLSSSHVNVDYAVYHLSKILHVQIDNYLTTNISCGINTYLANG